LFHVAEVDDTVTRGAKEGGAVQPTFTVRKRAPDENLAVGKMGDRKILVGFEKRNVLDPHDPMFDFVIQENEIVTMKYGGLAFLALHSGSRRPLRFFLDCH
jgi:hypothetical protein